jgi:glycine cleavage system H protein
MSDPAPKRTPLYDEHVRAGARMVPFAGYDMPVQYPTGIIAEHNWTRSSAGLFDVSHMGQCFIEGPDTAAAAKALERLVPADVLALAPQQQRYAQLLAEDGGTLDDLMITRTAEDGTFYVVVNASRKDHDYGWIEAHLPKDVTLAPRDDLALVALQGPKAEAVMAKLAPDLADLRFMHSTDVAVKGLALQVSRSGYTGEDGYEISLAARDAVRLWTLLLEDERVKPVGLGARDSLRLEAGLCLYGHEPSASGGGARAASSAPPACRRNFRAARRAGASASGRRAARRRATAHWSPTWRAARSASSPRAASGRRSAALSPWAMSRRNPPSPEHRSSWWCAAMRCRPRSSIFPSSPTDSSAEEQQMSVKYSKDHEWVTVENGIATIGITNHAQEQLGDVVFVELPAVGKAVTKDAEAAVVESVKAASEVYAPVTGEVVAVNAELQGDPGLVNREAEGAAWFMKVKLANPAELDTLMDRAAYDKFVAG